VIEFSFQFFPKQRVPFFFSLSSKNIHFLLHKAEFGISLTVMYADQARIRFSIHSYSYTLWKFKRKINLFCN